MPRATHLQIPATDGTPLAATLFEPGGEAEQGGPAGGESHNGPKAAVLLSSATAVKRRYYQPFASFLAEAGLAVLTYDYRGVGGSRPARLKGYEAAMHQWATRDAQGALEWLAGRYPGLPLLLVGHSFGGQGLGLMPDGRRLSAALLVAAQSGSWRNWPGLHRLWMWTVWTLLIPASTALCGYFPAKRLGIAEDLPAGVAREWARWGRHPRYLLGAGDPAWEERFAGVRMPILAVSLSDDLYAPRRAAEHLLSFYSGARVRHRHVRPRDVGRRKIGHFGFFREACREPLWEECLAWLESQAGSSPPPPPAARG